MPAKDCTPRSKSKKNGSEEQMKHLLKIEIGDHSSDGHGKTDLFSFKANHSREEIVNAFGKALFENKIKSHAEATKLPICEEYEDFMMTKEFASALTAMGVDLKECYDYKENESFELESREYVHIWFLIAKTVLKTLEWEENVQDTTVRIGGYGFFW